MRLQFGDCTFDSEARTLRRLGADVRLSGKAFQLLETLLQARPKVLSKEELFSRIWPDTFVSEANLAGLVKEVRAAIGDAARAPRYIRTAHRFGYAFSGEVAELAGERKRLDSVAVLPFTNLSGNPDYDFLVEGAAESLINTLAAVDGLRVTPRSTSFRYRGREGELSILRSELNVSAIITGRLRLAGERVNLQVEVIDIARDTQLWGRQFDGAASRVLELNDDVGREVTVALGRSAPPAAPHSRARYAANNEAYQLYLKGRHHWNRRTLEGIERGIFYFQSAIDADAGFAPAYSGLADSYIALASRDLFPPAQLFPKAETAANKALEIDAELPEAHASIAAINDVFHWNWPAARGAFETALRLNPSYVTARAWYAQALGNRGEFEPAQQQFAIALENDPLSVMLNTSIGSVHYLAGKNDQAVTYLLRALEINPHHEPAHFILGLVHQEEARTAEAARELERSYAISHGEPHSVAALGHLGAKLGDHAEAGKRIIELTELASTRHVSPVHFATILAGLGDLDGAFTWLEKAVEERSGWLTYVRREPRFRELRKDGRWAAVMREMR
ncbi:MAG TPA: winged helix-turn-helix domain-containing protein [Thermoanaerobaculia bacterium]|nr:winged helix-turn-helix domain-containing protein [Thermoanaerobaculia bacterium]